MIKPLAVWSAILLLTVVIASPAAWQNPIDTLKKMTFSPLVAGHVVPTERIEGVLTPKASENNLPDIASSIVANEAQFTFLSQPFNYYIRYPLGYLWRVTPIIIIGLLAALAAFPFKLSIFRDKRIRYAVSGLVFFVLVFTLFVTLASKSSYKYFLPVYPSLDLIAGLGWFAATDYVVGSRFKNGKNLLKTMILTMIVLLQLYSALSTFPYYATYFNPLLGGSKKAGSELPIGSGEGLDMAARYLNQKPNSETLKVLSWYGIGPFSYYFNGETSPMYSDLWTEKLASSLKEMDYLVVYARQWKDRRPIGLLPHLEDVEPEHTIMIDGVEFARIYDVRKLPPEVYLPYDAEN